MKLKDQKRQQDPRRWHDGHDTIEKLWAKELYETNVDDSETINDEIHGVLASFSSSSSSSSSYVNIREEEWPEQQHNFYLNWFQIEIHTKIPPQEKQAYQLGGLELGSTYIHSSEFRLGFCKSWAM